MWVVLEVKTVHVRAAPCTAFEFCARRRRDFDWTLTGLALAARTRCGACAAGAATNGRSLARSVPSAPAATRVGYGAAPVLALAQCERRRPQLSGERGRCWSAGAARVSSVLCRRSTGRAGRRFRCSASIPSELFASPSSLPALIPNPGPRAAPHQIFYRSFMTPRQPLTSRRSR